MLVKALNGQLTALRNVEGYDQELEAQLSLYVAKVEKAYKKYLTKEDN